jgi:hypothetical protein
MQTVLRPRKVEGRGTAGHEAAPRARCTTTLYELLAALQDVVGPEDDALVVATVVHLLRSGRLTWKAKAPLSPAWCEARGVSSLSPRCVERTVTTKQQEGIR